MGAITCQGLPYGNSMSRCPAERSRKERHWRGGTPSLGLNLSSLSICAGNILAFPPSHTHGPRPWHLVWAPGYPAALLEDAKHREKNATSLGIPGSPPQPYIVPCTGQRSSSVYS